MAIVSASVAMQQFTFVTLMWIACHCGEYVCVQMWQGGAD
jgi:hypothetical protein